MKAALYEGNKTFRTGKSEPVKPGPGQVRLKVAYCGICGTDVHIYHGNMDKRVSIPHVIGHEVSAEVAEVGPDVSNVAPGGRVAVRPLQFGRPTPFDKGHAHVGKNLKFIGIDTPGGMQGSWTVPAYALHKIPDNVSLLHGAMIEPAAVACHDVRRGEVRRGENCVVLGCGPIGLLISEVARLSGAKVTISEVNPTRVELARSLGFTTVNPQQENLIEKVEELTGGAMADVVFEVSGSQAGVEVMTELPNVRGRIVMVAIHSQPRTISLFKFFWCELRMIGARLYEPEDFQHAIALAGEGKLPLDEIITRVNPIDEVQKVFETIDGASNGMKYVIKCSE